MYSMIANKVKTNMSLVSIKRFIVRTILCATVLTYTECTTITTTVTIRSLPSFLLTTSLFAYNFFASHTCFISTKYIC